LNLYK